jgi:hypothetical protein
VGGIAAPTGDAGLMLEYAAFRRLSLAGGIGWSLDLRSHMRGAAEVRAWAAIWPHFALGLGAGVSRELHEVTGTYERTGFGVERVSWQYEPLYRLNGALVARASLGALRLVLTGGVGWKVGDPTRCQYTHGFFEEVGPCDGEQIPAPYRVDVPRLAGYGTLAVGYDSTSADAEAPLDSRAEPDSWSLPSGGGLRAGQLGGDARLMYTGRFIINQVDASYGITDQFEITAGGGATVHSAGPTGRPTPFALLMARWHWVVNEHLRAALLAGTAVLPDILYGSGAVVVGIGGALTRCWSRCRSQLSAVVLPSFLIPTNPNEDAHGSTLLPFGGSAVVRLAGPLSLTIEALLRTAGGQTAGYATGSARLSIAAFQVDAGVLLAPSIGPTVRLSWTSHGSSEDQSP